MTDPLIDALRGIVGVPHVLDSAPDMAPFLSDWRGRYHGTARAVVRPHDTAELAAVVGTCAAAGVPMVPQASPELLSIEANHCTLEVLPFVPVIAITVI